MEWMTARGSGVGSQTSAQPAARLRMTNGCPPDRLVHCPHVAVNILASLSCSLDYIRNIVLDRILLLLCLDLLDTPICGAQYVRYCTSYGSR